MTLSKLNYNPNRLLFFNRFKTNNMIKTPTTHNLKAIQQRQGTKIEKVFLFDAFEIWRGRKIYQIGANELVKLLDEQMTTRHWCKRHQGVYWCWCWLSQDYFGNFSFRLLQMILLWFFCYRSSTPTNCMSNQFQNYLQQFLLLSVLLFPYFNVLAR